MSDYSIEELRAMGLKAVGAGVRISREALIYRPERIEIGDYSRVDDFVTLTAGSNGFIKIGSCVHIAAYSMIEAPAGVCFGDFSGFAARVTLYGGGDDYGGEFLTNPTVPYEYRKVHVGIVHIGKHAVVGANSVILPGAKIGDGCAIGAMSLVKGELAPFGIYVGAPARRVRERSRHILELESRLRSQNPR